MSTYAIVIMVVGVAFVAFGFVWLLTAASGPDPDDPNYR